MGFACVRALICDASESQFTKAADAAGHGQSYVQRMSRGALRHPSKAVLQILIIARSLVADYSESNSASTGGTVWKDFNHCSKQKAVMISLCNLACESAESAGLLCQLGSSDDKHLFGDISSLKIDCAECGKSRVSLFDRLILFFVNSLLDKVAARANEEVKLKADAKKRKKAAAKDAEQAATDSTPLRVNATIAVSSRASNSAWMAMPCSHLGNLTP